MGGKEGGRQAGGRQEGERQGACVWEGRNAANMAVPHLSVYMPYAFVIILTIMNAPMHGDGSTLSLHPTLYRPCSAMIHERVAALLV